MAVTTQWLQEVTYAARIDRTLIDNVWTEGILGADSFGVSERDAGTNMTVDAAAGVAVVTGDDQVFQGKYLCREQAATTGLVITAAPGSGTRHDLVVLQVQDANAGGTAGDNAILKVVAGATGNSTDPAVPDSALVLARVRVATGTTAITDAMIDDLRVLSRLSHEVVDTAALADLSVTESKLAGGSVTVSKIDNGAVSAAKLDSAVLSSAWATPTLAAGWSDGDVRYKRVGNVGFVMISGVERTGATTTSATVFTLPSGFLPGFTASGFGRRGSSNDNVWVTVAPSGAVTMAGTTGVQNFATVTFPLA